jgi:hypothetical protein
MSERQLRAMPLNDFCSPGPPVHSRAGRLTLARRAHDSKGNFPARPRTHVAGQFLTLATGRFMIAGTCIDRQRCARRNHHGFRQQLATGVGLPCVIG